MPRHGRIDYPGALHHVIVRGINRTAIFHDDRDRHIFIVSLERGLGKTGLQCHAWALLSNHLHLLLQTVTESLTKLMRSLLTGYAIYFNRRHKRVGYLFQNRYKSILCEREKYFLHLVRYIHLNPLRAGIVGDISRLNRYRWCGHGTILGYHQHPWQNTSEVRRQFGEDITLCRRRYMRFVIQGVAEGRREDLCGGGLFRSIGGWHNLRALKCRGERVRGDERILGSTAFVEQVLGNANERLTRQTAGHFQGWTLKRLLSWVAHARKASRQELLNQKKTTPVSEARALFIWLATAELGYTAAETAGFLSINRSSALRAAPRGRSLAAEMGWKLSIE